MRAAVVNGYEAAGDFGADRRLCLRIAHPQLRQAYLTPGKASSPNPDHVRESPLPEVMGPETTLDRPALMRLASRPVP